MATDAATPPEGNIFFLNKPLCWTSFDVVKKIRWLLTRAIKAQIQQDSHVTPPHSSPRVKIKVGHAGTLDPLATGLLIVCTGKFTKKIQEIQDQEKEYTGTITLGATTPSFDLETGVDKTFPLENITEEKINEAAKKLTGSITQIPPVFSAKKIEGKRAYEHARKGKAVEMKSVRITIKEFEITAINIPHVQFRIVCSKGTYLRSVARDLGELLGNGAHLTRLCRTRIGNYRIEEALTIEEFEKLYGLMATQNQVDAGPAS